MADGVVLCNVVCTSLVNIELLTLVDSLLWWLFHERLSVQQADCLTCSLCWCSRMTGCRIWVSSVCRWFSPWDQHVSDLSTQLNMCRVQDSDTVWMMNGGKCGETIVENSLLCCVSDTQCSLWLNCSGSMSCRSSLRHLVNAVVRYELLSSVCTQRVRSIHTALRTLISHCHSAVELVSSIHSVFRHWHTRLFHRSHWLVTRLTFLLQYVT